MTSYQPKALPLGDDGFVRSFTLGDDQQMCPDALAFFDEFGFCVVDSVSFPCLSAEPGREGE